MCIITKRLKLVSSKVEHETDAMFDSSASYSFIRRDIAEWLGPLDVLPEPRQFEMAEKGKMVIATERITLDFLIDGYRFSDEFLVLDNLADETIIGGNTMQKMAVQIRYGT